jgi:hypothetical protein
MTTTRVMTTLIAGPDLFVFSLFRNEAAVDGGWSKLALYASLFLLNAEVRVTTHHAKGPRACSDTWPRY